MGEMLNTIDESSQYTLGEYYSLVFLYGTDYVNDAIKKKCQREIKSMFELAHMQLMSKYNWML